MSHWTKVNTQIKNINALKKALSELGLEYQAGDFSITQYDTTEKAEIKLDEAVGFSRQADGTFAMVGDFYHSKIPGLRKYYGKTSKFQSDVQTAYAVQEATLHLEEQQFTQTERVETDEYIELTFERY